jgi:hypothetical protein
MNCPNNDHPLSPEELDQVLACAAAEGWTELALIRLRNDLVRAEEEDRFPENRRFQVHHEVEIIPAGIERLGRLSTTTLET